MNSTALIKYGLRYVLAYVIASIALSAIGLLLQSVLPGFSFGAAAGVSVIMAGGLYALDKFLSDNDRPPTAAEYWLLVLLFTVIGAALEAMKLVIIGLIFPVPSMPSGLWLLAFTIAAALVLLTNMLVLSKVFSGPQLKNVRKRRAKKS